MIHIKKAQGISINTIIIAAIALIVLVVLIAIFTGRLGEFSTGVVGTTGDVNKECNAQKPNVFQLMTVEQCNTAKGKIIASSDTAGDQICCTKQRVNQ